MSACISDMGSFVCACPALPCPARVLCTMSGLIDRRRAILTYL